MPSPSTREQPPLVTPLAWVLAFVVGLQTGAAWGEDRSGVRPEVMNLPGGPGSLEGLGESFEPNLSTGTAHYTIPIRLPEAAGGFGPSLALHYSTGAGNGELGLGWSLGLPVVQRGTDRGLPLYDDDLDQLVLRGLGGAGAEDLVRLDDGSYRFRIEGAFIRGRRRTDGQGFEFQTRDGTQYRFGTADAATIRDGDAGAFAWLLAEIEDTRGNRVTYEWEPDETGRPYLRRILWNDHGEAARCEVLFEYEGRPDALTSYLSTFAVTTAQRLSLIRVRRGGQDRATYRLGYEGSGAVSRLISVQAVGRDGETELPALTMSYAELTDDASRIVSLADAPARQLGTEAELDDVDGDALPDLLVMDSAIEGGRYVWYPNLDGESFGERVVMASSPAVWLNSSGVQFADVDGDAAADVVARLSSGSDGLRYYPGGDPDGFGEAVIVTPNPSFNLEDPDVRLVDLNHDRRTDWMHIDPSTGRVSVAFNEGSGLFTEAEDRPAISEEEVLSFSRGLRFADLNGDGLPDLVAVRSGSVRYWPGRGYGMFDEEVEVAGAPEIEGEELEHLEVRDLDGDGLADLVAVGVRRVRYWLNLSGLELAAEGTVEDTPEVRPTTTVRAADMNGNGTVDIVWIDPTAPDPWRYLDLLADGAPGLLDRVENGRGLVVTLSYAGLGRMRRWARENDVEWSRRSPVGQSVLAEIQLDDSLGNVTEQRFYYADGYFDGGAREFRGFGRVFAFDVGDEDQPTLVTETVFDVGDLEEALKGSPLSVERRTEAPGEVFDRGETTYEVRTLETAADGTLVRHAYAQASDLWVFDLGDEPVHLSRTEEQDDYGNVVSETNYGQVCGEDRACGDDEVIIEREFAIDREQWIVGAVSRERILALDGTRLAEKRTYYDGEPFEGLPLGEVTQGQATRVEEWVSGDHFSQTMRVRRDQWGNVVEQLNPRDGRTELTYDDESHTYLITERTEVEAGRVLEWHSVYDSVLGVTTELIDADGQIYRWQYDALGRVIAEIEPGDSEELPTARHEYHLGNPSSYVRSEQRVTSGEEDVEVSITYVDGLGRERGAYTRAEESRWVADGFVRYGRRGAVEFEGNPFFASSADLTEVDDLAGGVRFAYDSLGRVISEREVDDSERRRVYTPLRVTRYDENDIDTTSPHQDTPTDYTYDGLNRLRSVLERNDDEDVVTSYGYDASGQLTRLVDARGSERRYGYDGLGRRTTVSDPNAGDWTFNFNDAGDLLERRDPTGSVVRYRYDFVGRATQESHQLEGGEEQVVVRLHHDEPSPEHPRLGHVAGQLSWVEDQAGTVFFGYDARGRRTDQIRRWTDGREQALWIDHDAAGRVTRRGFPDGTHLELAYNERGLLRQVGPLITETRWTAEATLDEMRYGNGVTDERTYDDRLRPSALVARGPGGDALRDLLIEYDRCSQITAVTDRRGTSAAEDLGAQYDYDARGRLTTSTDAGGSTRWDYDEVANILAVSSTNRAEHLNVVNGYGEDGAGPDQRTSFGEERLEYDAAGRLSRDGSRVLIWDAKSRLVRVEREGVVEEYTYDYQDRRVLRRTTSDGRTSVARTLERDVEERDGSLVRYVSLGDQRAIRLDPIPESAVAARSATGAGLSRWFGPEEARGLACATVAVLILLSLIGLSVQLVGPKRTARLAGATLGLSMALACPASDSDVDPRLESHAIEGWPAGAVLYLGDVQSNPVVVADAAGEAISRRAYHPYGAVREAPDGTFGDWTEPFGFVGNEEDPGSGLSDFGARPYLREAGMFGAPDPVAVFPDPAALEELLKDPGAFYAYAYSRGDPIDIADGDGEWVVPVIAGVVLVASLIVAWESPANAPTSAKTPTEHSITPSEMAVKAAPIIAGEFVGLGVPVAGNALGKVLGTAGKAAARGGGRVAGRAASSAGARLSNRSSSEAGQFARAARRGGPGVCFLMGTLVALPGGGFAPIEELKVGSRVMTTDAEEVETEVDETWRVAEIEMPNPQAPDDQIRIELARPTDWFEEAGAQDGRWIWFTLQEMGLEGWAKVVRIRGLPEVEDGAGRVVLATVTHLNTELFEVRLGGEVEPIHPTATHRLFSEDRGEWVATQDLFAGEQLRTACGTAIIESISALPGVHRVFNIEVETEHEFFVSTGRVLSHNLNPCGPPSIRSRLRDAGLEGLPGGRSTGNGPYRFRPDEGYNPAEPLRSGPHGGYMDRFDNEWVQGPFHGDPATGFHREWDVILSKQGVNHWGKNASVGSGGQRYLNVRPDGWLSH